MESDAKLQYLQRTIEHIDITHFNSVPLVEAMATHGIFGPRPRPSGRDIRPHDCRPECGIILCLAGSLVSAGLKKVFVEMLRCHMVDAIVSTGANLVDQDFFEALGFQHYMADAAVKTGTHDSELRSLHIDRIYDTLIDEEQLRNCDETVRKIADELPPRRIFIAGVSGRDG